MTTKKTTTKKVKNEQVDVDKEAIEDFLKQSQTRARILTPEMQEIVITMVKNKEDMTEVMKQLKEHNPKVKRQHVRNFLKRYL